MEQGIVGLLDTVPVGSLATVGVDGRPWVVPVHFTHDEESIYWFSSELSIHSQNIAADQRIGFTFWSPDESHGLAGVYLQSYGQLCQDRANGEQLYAAKFGEMPESFAKYQLYRAPLGQLNTQKSKGAIWYLSSE